MRMPQNDTETSLTTKADFQEKYHSFCKSTIASVPYSNTHGCQKDQQSCLFGDLKK